MMIWLTVAVMAVVLALLVATASDTSLWPLLVPAALAAWLVIWGIRRLSSSHRVTR